MITPSLDNLILLWVAGLGLFAFAMMGYDKIAAKMSTRKRVREKNFWMVAALGGFAGIGLGALIFHHKTSKKSFWPPVITSIIVWLALLYFLKII